MPEDPGGYGELGVALSDSVAAARRLREQDGLSRQADWGRRYLNDTVWAVAVVMMVLTAFVGVVSDLPAAAKALTVVLPAAAGLAVLAGILWRRRTIDRRRRAQLAAHRAATEAGYPSAAR